MRNRLVEIDYEKIFSPKTMANLTKKSAQSLQQLRSQFARLTGRDMMALLDEIIAAEDGNEDELEMLAVQIVKDVYPIIDHVGINIDAKIVGRDEISNDINQPSPQPPLPPQPDIPQEPSDNIKAKRRVINGITQGAAVRGGFAFLLIKEYIDHLNSINPDLLEKYNNILKMAFGIYDDENLIAMLLAMVGMNQNQSGGDEEAYYDEDEETFVIKARAICFSMLVHEIVKGLYEVVGTQGFAADDYETQQAAINAVDKLENEPRDLQYGKFIYDAVNQLFINSDVDDARIRELFFGKLYELPDRQFISFAENAFNDELTSDQKEWAKNTMKDLENQLKRYDTGLPGLD